jgi:hypothetical protein
MRRSPGSSLTSLLCTGRPERVVELLKEVTQIAKAVGADELRPLALDRRGAPPSLLGLSSA